MISKKKKKENDFFFFFNFYLFMIVTQRERGRDTGRGRSRLHAPGARRGTRSRVSRIAPWAKGRRQTAAPPRDPSFFLFKTLSLSSCYLDARCASVTEISDFKILFKFKLVNIYCIICFSGRFKDSSLGYNTQGLLHQVPSLMPSPSYPIVPPTSPPATLFVSYS